MLNSMLKTFLEELFYIKFMDVKLKIESYLFWTSYFMQSITFCFFFLVQRPSNERELFVSVSLIENLLTFFVLSRNNLNSFSPRLSANDLYLLLGHASSFAV